MRREVNPRAAGAELDSSIRRGTFDMGEIGKAHRMHIIGLILIGLVVGLLGRLFHKGRDPMGLLMTIAIGIASVLIAGLLIHGFLGFVIAIIVGVVLVGLWSRFVAPRRESRWRRAFRT